MRGKGERERDEKKEDDGLVHTQIFFLVLLMRALGPGDMGRGMVLSSFALVAGGRSRPWTNEKMSDIRIEKPRWGRNRIMRITSFFVRVRVCVLSGIFEQIS